MVTDHYGFYGNNDLSLRFVGRFSGPLFLFTSGYASVCKRYKKLVDDAIATRIVNSSTFRLPFDIFICSLSFIFSSFIIDKSLWLAALFMQIMFFSSLGMSLPLNIMFTHLFLRAVCRYFWTTQRLIQYFLRPSDRNCSCSKKLLSPRKKSPISLSGLSGFINPENEKRQAL